MVFTWCTEPLQTRLDYPARIPLWAFSVVLFVGFSIALTDETRLKERITFTLDPWLRKVGMNGRDLIPVLTGYGCNVVAVFQTKSCAGCTRKQCMSMAAIHTRLWYPHLAGVHPPAALPSIKKPQWSGIRTRVQATVTQFFLQARPIF